MRLAAQAGRTPNPDVMCNSRIKFGTFLDRVGCHFSAVASGHYARTGTISSAPGRSTSLLTSMDEHKDQTYFLSQLTQEQLQRVVFPIGALRKPQVRERALAYELPNRARKDSQGICFLGQLNYDGFLRAHLGEREGDVIDYESGEPIGTHRGLWFHTVGQRRGLVPVLSNRHAARGPWYVVKKDVPNNVLYASRHYHAGDKQRNRFVADSINWISGSPPSAAQEQLSLQVKVRHGASIHRARVLLEDDGHRAHVELEQRDKGLAPGQFAAFYDDNVCLGSGVIAEEGLY